ncbi:MAG: class I SAM-dependent methyltransferase, partial [Eubacteriales bacterium]|nr:class I SAM-dependent methyltransferase [Eubacteriales bacterium]
IQVNPRCCKCEVTSYYLFCEIYNQFGWNYFPEAFATQLLTWLEQHDREVHASLDLGCGTGVLCRILHEHGIRSQGMDFSSGMIEIASRENPEIRFECADMITYQPGSRFDLVTCTGDALNHIFAIEDIERIFQNVYSCLNDGGLFIFDILSEKEGQEMEDIPFTYDEKTTALFSIVRKPDRVIELHTKVFENG